MKFKIVVSIISLIVVLPVLADDTPQPALPAYVQNILTKYDKQVDTAQRTYWQAVLAADKAKLKDLQAAMITAAKQNNADVIPIIQKAIDETKEKIEQNAGAIGTPTTHSNTTHVLAVGIWVLNGGDHSYNLIKDGTFTCLINSRIASINGSWFLIGDVLVLLQPANGSDPSWIRFGKIEGDTANIMLVVGGDKGQQTLKRMK